jgi:hypothetical protein
MAGRSDGLDNGCGWEGHFRPGWLEVNQLRRGRLRIAGDVVLVDAALLLTYGIVLLLGAPATPSLAKWLIAGLTAAVAIGVGAVGIALRGGRRWAYILAWVLVVFGILGWLGNPSFWNWLALLLSLAIGGLLLAGTGEVRKSRGSAKG